MPGNTLTFQYDGSGDALEAIEDAEHQHQPHEVIINWVGGKAAEGYTGCEWSRNPILEQARQETIASAQADTPELIAA